MDYSLDGEVLLGELTAEFRVYDGDDDEGRDTVLQVVTVYTALVDIPEDPESGRPAVPQGTKVTHMLDETYTLTSSEGPFVLFPDATFEDARD